MVYWLKNQKKDTIKKETPEEKKEKEGRAKRLDSLRVHKSLDIALRSLGNEKILFFKTRDVSASGVFVSNEDFKNLPFIVNSTLICARIFLMNHPKKDVNETVDFIAKIARMVYPDESFPKLKPGLGLRLVQIDERSRKLLNSYIASHGEPDHVQTSKKNSEPLSRAG
jgi:hypothetical protein